MSRPLTFDGVLFFPVTPFGTDGEVDVAVLADHVASRMDHPVGGVFAACGTGEFHALDAAEVATVVATTVRTVGGRVPVFAGTGGPYRHARSVAAAARSAGADGLLVMPPYLVTGPQAGLAAYVEGVVEATDLPAVLYHRGAAALAPRTLERLLADPRVIGVKDGVGDLAVAQELVLTARRAGRGDVHFFNGLLTAELSQAAYRGVGVPLYSSAAFAMAPGVATAFYRAYAGGDEAGREHLLDAFYRPLVRLRDTTPGFGVSLVKAGLRLAGTPVGSVRPPLVDPAPVQMEELARILAVGEELAGGGGR